MAPARRGFSPKRRLLVYVGVTVVALSVTSRFAQSQASAPEDLIGALQDILLERSSVLDVTPDGAEGQRLTTRIEVTAENDIVVLAYRRTYFQSGDPLDPALIQHIHYRFTLADLAPDTTKVQTLAQNYSREPMHLVSVRVRTEKGFIPYSNLVEERAEGGTIETTGSRGKAGVIVFGYFRARQDAQDAATELERVLRARRRGPETR